MMLKAILNFFGIRTAQQRESTARRSLAAKAAWERRFVARAKAAGL